MGGLSSKKKNQHRNDVLQMKYNESKNIYREKYLQILRQFSANIVDIDSKTDELLREMKEVSDQYKAYLREKGINWKGGDKYSEVKVKVNWSKKSDNKNRFRIKSKNNKPTMIILEDDENCNNLLKPFWGIDQKRDEFRDKLIAMGKQLLEYTTARTKCKDRKMLETSRLDYGDIGRKVINSYCELHCSNGSIGIGGTMAAMSNVGSMKGNDNERAYRLTREIEARRELEKFKKELVLI